jgi:hypothetical protein
MRTKTTLAAAAILAAGLASSMAQANVYSLNVVGYVNVSFAPAITALANPLDGNPNNLLNTVFSGANIPDNTQILRWDQALQDFDPSGNPTYNNGAGVWNINAPLDLGTCYFVLSGDGTPFTHTFVGEVHQGTTTKSIPTGFNALGSIPPIAGNAATVMAQYSPGDNDLLFKWDPSITAFFDPVTFVLDPPAGPAWVDPASGPITIGVGEGFFLLPSAANSWTRTFTVAP